MPSLYEFGYGLCLVLVVLNFQVLLSDCATVLFNNNAISDETYYLKAFNIQIIL
jgi:hypothetical protein